MRVLRTQVGGPAECAGAVGGGGVLKTADICMNCALDPARFAPSRGRRIINRSAQSAGPISSCMYVLKIAETQLGVMA